MKVLSQLTFLLLFTAGVCAAQDKEYFKELSVPTGSYSAGTVAARMVDGLGFRFYWATQGLTEKNLLFKPNEEARTVDETIDHIYGMSVMIANAVLQKSNRSQEGLSFELKRQAVLDNLKAVSDVLRESDDEDLNAYVVKGSANDYPFWNLVNGPIADCIWHCGQIVSFRRTSGNPLNGNVSFFNGRLRN